MITAQNECVSLVGGCRSFDHCVEKLEPRYRHDVARIQYWYLFIFIVLRQSVQYSGLSFEVHSVRKRFDRAMKNEETARFSNGCSSQRSEFRLHETDGVRHVHTGVRPSKALCNPVIALHFTDPLDFCTQTMEHQRASWRLFFVWPPTTFFGEKRWTSQ